MNEIVKPSRRDDRPVERQADRFITRWLAGDRNCIPAGPGALVTVPYPGLRSFKPELNQFFFGRERQKAELKSFFAGRSRGTGEARRQITFVVGGSGSGKSSLTLAGLIAELNTIDMATISGAWYVAQMRPAQDPIEQLLTSLNMVVTRIIDVIVADPMSDGAAERLARIAAGLNCPDAKDLPALREQLHDRLVERLAPLDKATGRRSLAIAALFQFVDETLDRLDEIESHAQRSGKPLLLIHIDQFEEVFREQTDADGRQALMQLLRKVHEYAPERLFIVATMRSEELHKCSEFEGIADVVNSSMYLIDLVSNEDIERAIVEPARRQTTLWELPITSSETAPYTAEAVRWLQRAYQTAGTAALHTADQLPLLQHFLPLLWEEAVDDWFRCREKDPAARFEITRDHIEKVPGWILPERSAKEAAPVASGAGSQNQQSHLGRCLNAHADTVLKQAIEKWGGVEGTPVPDRSPDGKVADSPKAGFGNPSPERAALIVAFCCLAQLDDRGRPARRFASLEDIVEASGLTEWKTPKYDRIAFGKGLARELSEFEKAGLIERIGSEEPLRYNVNHEAFIRNWASYEGWLKEKQFVQQRLRDIDSSAGRLNNRKSRNPLVRIFSGRARDAYAVIPDETGARLQSVFGDEPIFSRAWVVAALSNQSATGAARAPANSFSAIEDVWENARWWQKNSWTLRLFWFVVGVAVAALVIGAVVFGRIASRNQTQNYQLYNSIISLRTNLSEFRSAVQYRELYASLQIADGYDASSRLEDEPLQILRETLFQVDSGVRKILGNEVSLRFSNTPSGAAKANCKITGGETTELEVQGPGNVKLGLSRGYGYWKPADLSASDRGVEQPAQTPDGIPLPDNTLLCLSHDARWLMFWTDSSYPPVLTRIVWSRPKQPNGEWTGKLLPQRQMNSTVDLTKLTDEKTRLSYDYLRHKLTREALEKVESFNEDGQVGFSLPIPENDSRLLIWSTTGLLDPDDSGYATSIEWQPCKYSDVSARPGTGSRKIKECGFPVEYDRIKRDLAVSYAEGDCKETSLECQSTIELRYQQAKSDEKKSKEPSVQILDNFATIRFARLQDGWLWLKDKHENTWRYMVAKDKIAALIALKWQGVTWNDDGRTGGENFRPSKFCRLFPACLDYLSSEEGQWPIPSKKLLGDLQ
ncbi:AAA family ATPase [Bradyrhizobium prioriisuperbiae]|uniref:nSTAND1 domain-containing NTPase n=1 Tax=Bradyrhizobium prioriisuperbiae TaxID=2854389 RepID=UPI0028EB5A19|nr:AAA family ATPase [Bradyrhizobium prioritasuperba]